MINRINLILRAKNITARQFAEEIGIQPSGMSHILGGRNNPSLEFVTKVIRRYPEIDANWLLLGRGEMYTGLTPNPSPEERVGLTPSPSPMEMGMDTGEPTLFSMSDPSPAPTVETQRAPFPIQQPQHTDGESEHDDGELQHNDMETQHAASLQEGNILSQGRRNEPLLEERKPSPALGEGRRLVKILMFYDDHSFEEYYPRS